IQDTGFAGALRFAAAHGRVGATTTMKTLNNIIPIAPAPVPDELGAQVAIVMEQYPELAAYGFHFSAPDWMDVARYQAQRAEMLTADFNEQVATCLDAIAQPRTRRDAWKIKQHSSYVLKHM